MLPKKYRITFPHFRSLPVSYTMVSTTFFAARVKKNNADNPRFVILVPKSLDKRSSWRNKTKRIIVAFLLASIHRLQGSFDISLRVKRIVTFENKSPVLADLKQLLVRIGVLAAS